MPDVFDGLVGQHQAVSAMRQFAKGPVHAYLIAGPVGSSLHDAALAFAAALQCPDNGCGNCESCRLVMSEHDPDVYFAERSGVSWRIDELREAERVGRRRPLGEGYQIIVIEEIELSTTGASPSAPALLKSLEEPPSRTIYLLTAENVPTELGTIVSRCVEMKLKSLNEVDVREVLVREGADQASAQVAANAANGNVRRARVLVRDTALVQRIERWRSVPARLNGTPAMSSVLATEISGALDDAMAPLQELQEEELARRVLDAREMGQRSVANRREIEAQFKREQRRFRIDELRFGLTALTSVYRERLADNLTFVGHDDATSEYRVGTSIRAIEAVAEASRRLSSNVDETLLLNDLMLSLMEF